MNHNKEIEAIYNKYLDKIQKLSAKQEMIMNKFIAELEAKKIKQFQEDIKNTK